MRVTGVTCDGDTGVGSGFLVGPDLVATAAHVVDEAAWVSVRAGVQVTGAALAGSDSDTDVALLRLDRPVEGHLFSWAAQSPRVGDEVAAIGYPLGQPIAMTRGAVTAVDRSIEVAGQERTGLVQTDAAINPGNSGGPLITVDGLAAGIVDAGSDAAGDAYAIAVGTASDAVGRWAAEGWTEELAMCTDVDRDLPSGFDDIAVTITSAHPEAPSLAQTFRLYADAINSGDYDTAYALLRPPIRGDVGSLEQFAEQLSTSYWLTIDVVDVTVVDATTDDVELHFRTVQAPEYGPDGRQVCSDWQVMYRMVLDSGFWQIDKARRLAPPGDCSAEYGDVVGEESEAAG